MEFKEFKDLLFKKALNKGFEECEIYFSNKESIGISVYEQELEKYNINTTFGLSFRGKINGKIGYSYTEILDEEAIDMLITNAKEGANSIENDDVQFIYDGDKEYEKVNFLIEKVSNITIRRDAFLRPSTIFIAFITSMSVIIPKFPITITC